MPGAAHFACIFLFHISPAQTAYSNSSIASDVPSDRGEAKNINRSYYEYLRKETEILNEIKSKTFF
jgi:hypothetical protein